MHAATISANLPTDAEPTAASGDCPRWLHAVAVLTVLAALPLLFLGAEVTTKGVGMADHRPLVNPLQALWEMLTGEQALGWRIEHSHRLAGWVVGLLVTILAVGLWWQAPTRGLRGLAVAAWCLVSIQGLLGIFRVGLHAMFGPTLALVHGSFAQIVFATLVGVTVVSSRRWSMPAVGVTAGLRRVSLVVVGLLLMQLVLGGLLRHQSTLLAARGHLVGAFVVAAGLLWLVKLAWHDVALRGPAVLLVVLLGLQVLVGVEAWMSWMKRVYMPLAGVQESAATHWLRSGHYLLGALIFATTVALALLAHRGGAADDPLSRKRREVAL
jgi:heme A synthase